MIWNRFHTIQPRLRQIRAQLPFHRFGDQDAQRFSAGGIGKHLGRLFEKLYAHAFFQTRLL
jgi:hypothetical protein